MENKEVVDYVLARFREGKGAELRVARGDEMKRLILVPSPVFSEDTDIGLAIACEDEGFHFWNGLNPLNGFDLISSGFRLKVAFAVANLIVELFPCRVRRRLNSPQGHNQTGVSPH